MVQPAVSVNKQKKLIVTFTKKLQKKNNRNVINV